MGRNRISKNELNDDLQLELKDSKDHEGKIASTTELGHIKIDGETITIDEITGVASATSKGSGIIYAIATSSDGMDYIITSPEITEYNAGLRIVMQADKESTGSSSVYVNINNLGRVRVSQQNSYFATAGTIMVGIPYTLTYNGGMFIIEGTSTKLNNTLTSTSTTEGATANTVKLLNDKVENSPIELTILPPFTSAFPSWDPVFRTTGKLVSVSGGVKVSSTINSNTILNIPPQYSPNHFFSFNLYKQRGSVYDVIGGVVNNGGSFLIQSEDISKVTIGDYLTFNVTYAIK